jgi:hypothetical protein
MQAIKNNDFAQSGPPRKPLTRPPTSTEPGPYWNRTYPEITEDLYRSYQSPRSPQMDPDQMMQMQYLQSLYGHPAYPPGFRGADVDRMLGQQPLNIKPFGGALSQGGGQGMPAGQTEQMPQQGLQLRPGPAGMGQGGPGGPGGAPIPFGVGLTTGSMPGMQAQDPMLGRANVLAAQALQRPVR